jgi:hypothetical protein
VRRQILSPAFGFVGEDPLSIRTAVSKLLIGFLSRQNLEIGGCDSSCPRIAKLRSRHPEGDATNREQPPGKPSKRVDRS